MKVKIGNTVYSSDDQPIMVVLSPDDKKNIARMPEAATKYAEYPDGTPAGVIEKWMADEGTPAVCQAALGHPDDPLPHRCDLPGGHAGRHSCGLCGLQWEDGGTLLRPVSKA